MLNKAHLSFISLVKNTVGIVLFLVCSMAIYKKVIVTEQWHHLQNALLTHLYSIAIWQWLVLFLLMFLNFWTESMKWKTVVENTHPINCIHALKIIFVSQAFAFFTPNRIGEYAGRTLFLESNHKAIGIAQMAWTSYAQLLITICFGCAAVSIQMAYYPWLQHVWILGVQFILPFLVIIGIVLFFYQKKWKGRLGFLNSIQITNTIKIQLLIWSIARYAIFISQYFWVAYLLKMDIAYSTLLLSLAILFLLLSILPTISITELVIRGQLFIMILVPFYTHTLNIVSLSSIIWGVNFLFPSIIGTCLLLSFKIKK